jgi:signal transduction histidine kinase
VTVETSPSTDETSLTVTDEGRLAIGFLRSAVVAGCVLAGVGSTWLLVEGHADLWWNSFSAHNAAYVITLSYFLWRMIGRQPRNPVVWTLAASSFAGVYVAGTAIAVAIIEASPLIQPGSDLPALSVMPPSAAWVMAFAFPASTLAFFPLLTLGLLLFPDGRLPSQRWRVLAVLSVVAILVRTVGNEWSRWPGSGLWATRFETVGNWAYALALVLCVVAIILRFRRSRGTTRQQFKWVAWGASIFGVAVMATLIAPDDGAIRVPVFVAGVIFIGSYAVAVGRYRLYGVDLVISRTLVFVLLAGFITLVYAVLVVGLGQVIGRGEGLVLQIVATAVVAVAFEPVRLEAQRWANRVVYGRRATPYEVLSDLTERLAASEEGEGILGRMAQSIHEGTGADRVTVWLGSPEDMDPGATWPPDESPGPGLDLEADEVFRVSHDGEVVGALEVVKPRSSVMSHQERNLILDVAGSAGLVLGYQRLNQSLAERARDVDESRGRLMSAQDEERRRLQRELRDGAQRLVSSLREDIAQVSRLAERRDADQIESLLDSLEAESQLALDEIGSLARGIYPQALVSEGLTEAVSGLVDGAPVQIRFDQTGVSRHPIEVEAAVYFNISEAVTNAVKHARPPISIEMAEDDGVLEFAVIDAGPGFDIDDVMAGSGLQNMKDRMEAAGGRLSIVSDSVEGTKVSGEIPVESAVSGDARIEATVR